MCTVPGKLDSNLCYQPGAQSCQQLERASGNGFNSSPGQSLLSEFELDFYYAQANGLLSSSCSSQVVTVSDGDARLGPLGAYLIILITVITL